MNIHQQPGDWAANPTDFVNAWKHVVDVFRAQDVSNVKWVWTVNWADDPDGTINFREYYPGDSYVDWVGIDMYQFDRNSHMADPEYELNGLLGDSVYDEYASRKPIAINEYAPNDYLWQTLKSNPYNPIDTPDDKRADWLTKFFNAVESRPQIKWIGYYYAYNYHWAFDSSTPSTTTVYQTRIANPIYVST
jgi:beta-mannanase